MIWITLQERELVWAPQQQDEEEHENSDNEERDEHEIVKRSYKRCTLELRVNIENGIENIAQKKRAKRGRANKDQWKKPRNND